jgi:uncharacterized protein YjiS (DUF1127 family)
MMPNTACPKVSRPVSAAPFAARGLTAALLRAPSAMLDRLAAWQRRSDERAQMLKLTDRQLRDMGLNRAAVEEMARKASWSR